MVFDEVNWISIQEVRSDKGNDILLNLLYLLIIFKILKMVLAMVKSLTFKKISFHISKPILHIKDYCLFRHITTCFVAPSTTAIVLLHLISMLQLHVMHQFY